MQLPKFIEEAREIKTKKEQWLAYLSESLSEKEKEELLKMNKNIEEVDKIVDIVMSDKDIQQELMYRVLDKQLEDLKQQRAYENGQEARKRIRERTRKRNR